MQPGDFSVPFAESGSYPVRAGNRVRPLVDGEPAFRRISEAVEAAQHSVWLTVAWIWEAFCLPDGRGSLFDVLDAAAARGIDVRVIFYRHTAEGSFPRHIIFERDAGATAVAGEARLALLRALGFDAGLVVPPSKELDHRRRA